MHETTHGTWCVG